MATKSNKCPDSEEKLAVGEDQTEKDIINILKELFNEGTKNIEIGKSPEDEEKTIVLISKGKRTPGEW